MKNRTMAQTWTVFVAILSAFGMLATGDAQNPVSGACAAFAADGTLATGTLRNGELETKLDGPGGFAATTHAAIASIPIRGLSQRCEEAFSDDGQWLATVVPGNELNVVILDRKTKAIHQKFSSAWNRLRDMPIEPIYRSSFLGGFLQDNSLVLWRYVPRTVTKATDASHSDLHVQLWSVEGELLSDQNIGEVGFGPGGREPIALNGLSWLLIPIPTYCDGFWCYKSVNVSRGQIAGAGILRLPDENASKPVLIPKDKKLLSVIGRKTAQKVALLDLSGRVETQVSLPYFPNLLGPLVPDWFEAYPAAISRDGEVAAIARTRVAWVLMDTDRDWGSEITLLKIHPLALISKVKTGKGGIGAIAVDHHDKTVRLVGFWKERWHDLQCDEQHPDKCRE